MITQTPDEFVFKENRLKRYIAKAHISLKIDIAIKSLQFAKNAIQGNDRKGARDWIENAMDNADKADNLLIDLVEIQ